MINFLKKKIIKLGIICAIIFSLLFSLILVGVIVSYQNQKMIIANRYKEEQNSQLNSSMALSAEVEQYRGKVLEYAKANGIEEYIDLLLAVMMQESGGRGKDVYQCAESLGISSKNMTVEESISHGVELLAFLIAQSSVQSPTDIEHIRLCLQSYNFGTGYINYAIAYSGGWSQDSTFAYAEKYSKGVKRTGTKIEQLGIWKYGDQYYTDHVLRYYSYYNGGGNGSKVIEYANTLLGCPYVYGATGPNTFDCSGLVYYVFKMTGTYSGARTTAAGYKAIATPIAASDVQPGDLVFFTNASGTHHIGIYIGNGQMIHAPKTGDVVKVSQVWRNTDTITYGRLGN